MTTYQLEEMFNLDVLNKVLVYIPVALGIGVSAHILYLKYRNWFEALILKKLIWFFLIFNIVFAVAKIYIQYRVYAGDPIARLMLPPYQSWRWFEQYSFFHFIVPFLAALGAGIFLYYIVILINKYYKVVLSREEYLLLPLAALAVKWPNFALYIILIFALALLSAIISAVRQKKLDANISVSMENIMIAAMIITLLFGNEIGKYLKIYLLIV